MESSGLSSGPSKVPQNRFMSSPKQAQNNHWSDEFDDMPFISLAEAPAPSTIYPSDTNSRSTGLNTTLSTLTDDMDSDTLYNTSDTSDMTSPQQNFKPRQTSFGSQRHVPSSSTAYSKFTFMTPCPKLKEVKKRSRAPIRPSLGGIQSPTPSKSSMSNKTPSNHFGRSRGSSSRHSLGPISSTKTPSHRSFHHISVKSTDKHDSSQMYPSLHDIETHDDDTYSPQYPTQNIHNTNTTRPILLSQYNNTHNLQLQSSDSTLRQNTNSTRRLPQSLFVTPAPSHTRSMQFSNQPPLKYQLRGNKQSIMESTPQKQIKNTSISMSNASPIISSRSIALSSDDDTDDPVRTDPPSRSAPKKKQARFSNIISYSQRQDILNTSSMSSQSNCSDMTNSSPSPLPAQRISFTEVYNNSNNNINTHKNNNPKLSSSMDHITPLTDAPSSGSYSSYPPSSSSSSGGSSLSSSHIPQQQRQQQQIPLLSDEDQQAYDQYVRDQTMALLSLLDWTFLYNEFPRLSTIINISQITLGQLKILYELQVERKQRHNAPVGLYDDDNGSDQHLRQLLSQNHIPSSSHRSKSDTYMLSSSNSNNNNNNIEKQAYSHIPSYRALYDDHDDDGADPYYTYDNNNYDDDDDNIYNNNNQSSNNTIYRLSGTVSSSSTSTSTSSRNHRGVRQIKKVRSNDYNSNSMVSLRPNTTNNSSNSISSQYNDPMSSSSSLDTLLPVSQCGPMSYPTLNGPTATVLPSIGHIAAPIHHNNPHDPFSPFPAAPRQQNHHIQSMKGMNRLPTGLQSDMSSSSYSTISALSPSQIPPGGDEIYHPSDFSLDMSSPSHCSLNTAVIAPHNDVIPIPFAVSSSSSPRHQATTETTTTTGIGGRVPPLTIDLDFELPILSLPPPQSPCTPPGSPQLLSLCIGGLQGGVNGGCTSSTTNGSNNTGILQLPPISLPGCDLDLNENVQIDAPIHARHHRKSLGGQQQPPAHSRPATKIRSRVSLGSGVNAESVNVNTLIKRGVLTPARNGSKSMTNNNTNNTDLSPTQSNWMGSPNNNNDISMINSNNCNTNDILHYPSSSSSSLLFNNNTNDIQSSSSSSLVLLSSINNNNTNNDINYNTNINNNTNYNFCGNGVIDHNGNILMKSLDDVQVDEGFKDVILNLHDDFISSSYDHNNNNNNIIDEHPYLTDMMEGFNLAR